MLFRCCICYRFLITRFCIQCSSLRCILSHTSLSIFYTLIHFTHEILKCRSHGIGVIHFYVERLFHGFLEPAFQGFEPRRGECFYIKNQFTARRIKFACLIYCIFLFGDFRESITTAIVFLDEPTGGVDPITRRQFWELIYKESAAGKTIFVTTHYMDEAEYCDRVCIMVDGRIDALDKPKILKEQFNVSSMEEVFVHLARGKR